MTLVTENENEKDHEDEHEPKESTKPGKTTAFKLEEKTHFLSSPAFHLFLQSQLDPLTAPSSRRRKKKKSRKSSHSAHFSAQDDESFVQHLVGHYELWELLMMKDRRLTKREAKDMERRLARKERRRKTRKTTTNA